MGRPRKPREVKVASAYVIESVPLRHPPQANGRESVDPVRWYWAKNGWSDKKSDAHVFRSAEIAVRQIAGLRRVVGSAEINLAPHEGVSLYRPV